ncbi:craniofacial development protein 2-like [Mytilus edulis]|uniref:craniofacial development protein 2-like n=1 Tax=Mytilus edulis TaxID=6550 RepID=UPI0039EE53C9
METSAGMQPMTSDKTLRNSILSPKQTLKFGCWNVRTMNETSRTAQTIKEMKRFKLDILGVSESRWTDSGKYNSGTDIYYSGRTDGRHQEGVAILLSKRASKSVVEWIAIHERIIQIRMKTTSYGHMTVIQCYAPTNDYTDNEKENFYDKLNQIIMDTPKHDVLTIIGDFNTKVGSTNIGSEEVMGKHGLGEINNNGERLVEMCTMNNLVIGGTIFEHKNIHKATWVSPNGKVKNQIDHILINKKWRSSLLDVKVKRGADVYSDHHPIRLKLRKNKCKTPSKIIDCGKLKQPEIQQNFNIELKNRFEVLQLEENEFDINSKWQHMSEICLKTREDILGYMNKERKEWISEKTWALIMERKVLKSKTNQATREQQEVMKDLYNSKEKEVKKNAKADKKAYIDKIAEEAENASKVGDMRKLYNITKQA